MNDMNIGTPSLGVKLRRGECILFPSKIIGMCLLDYH